MGPACEMQERDNPPSPAPSRHDSDISSTPSADSRSSTPATSVDTPMDKQESGIGSAREDGRDRAHDHDGTATPRCPPARSQPDKMEERLRELQDKLAQLEQQSSLERLARQKMEKQYMDGLFPMASVALTEALASQPLSRVVVDEDGYDVIRGEMGIADVKIAARDPSVGRYTAVTVSLLESQLTRLKRDLGNINKLQEERDRLQDMKTLWEREREEMKKRLQDQQQQQQEQQDQQQQQQADQSGAGGQPTDSTNLPTDESSAVPAVPTQKHILNHVTWEGWRLCHLRPKGFSCAIDVLDGEPDVSFEQPMYYSYWEPARIAKGAAAKQRFNIAPKDNPGVVPGQGPIAERIRINSKHILHILSKIHGEDISVDDSPLVMIRPYKGLNYYNKAIRAKLLELKVEFGAKDKRPPHDIPTTETVPEQADAAPANAASAAAGEKGESKPEEAKDEWTFSPTAYEHLKLLVQFMDEQIEKKINYLEEGQFTRIPFTDIWYLFRPGIEVIDQTLRQAYRVVNVSSPSHTVFPPWRTRWDKAAKAKEETPVILICVYIDFDGKNLGPRIRKVRIPRYDNEKAVTSFEVFPLRFAEQRIGGLAQAASSGKGDEQAEMSLRDKLIARGRLFMDINMTGFKHMHYNGLTLDTRDEVDSNVVVDFQEAFAYNRPPRTARGPVKAEWQPELKNIVGEELDTEFEDDTCTAECCRITNEKYHQDTYGESKRNRDYIQRLMPEGRGEPPPSIYIRPLQEIKSQEEQLSDADYLIMSYRVFAFVLRSRKWAQLDLTHLRPPETQSSEKVLRKGVSRRQAKKRAINDEKRAARAEEGQDDDSDQDTDPEDDTAFGQLVLPRGHKKMVKSLVAQHFRDRESKEGQQVDIVSGKGKGLIILLHGAPGVGKTTTAEGVAEKFKSPLYQITCGDLGTSAPEVEKALETSFSLASRWGCVLLLDEADVFLAARSRIDFQRNGLVSVFLRVLEYYTGVLFLTTNRIGDFDEAFASRIHISLYYPQLDLDSTREIFELNLDMIESRLQDNSNSSNNQLKGDIRIDRNEILQYAKDYFENPAHKNAKWNGRQIRNACQTALALAEFRAHERRTHKGDLAARETTAVHLRVKDLKTVADAYLEFINYLNSLRGFDADDWATKLQIRAQDIDVAVRMALIREKEKAKGKMAAAADKEKQAHPSHKTDNSNKQDAPVTSLHHPPPQPPSTMTEPATASDFPTSPSSHQQRYGVAGGGGPGSGPVPPMAAAAPTAPQPIPPAQTTAGAALPVAPQAAYPQQGYYYGPPAGGGGYGVPQLPQGPPSYNPWYPQPQQLQQPQQQQPYGGAPQPPASPAPPPNTQLYYQQRPPPGPGQGQPIPPPARP
ncbi:hypothetical protein MAPG_09019 [Magnaporthiopsis poae ATCC 64411]|uniref:AAA+ ATPase domain-containing protein n=1 Tax=Magnaporthiopsis poae (strain ATCC 64411 / 73-15) TaxID=644358 RepID=A0A0C4E8V0_MAGP6|nr:hypothetical protein MAPG_09019 [Magnaporthiopsis poae ATCC 64411]